MRIRILTIGYWKKGIEQDLYNHYHRRITWKIELVELVDETKLPLLTKDLVIGLDENEMLVTSPELAHLLDHAGKPVTFIIGGHAGLTNKIKSQCHSLISLGRCTWPHLLVRGLLTEQLYRAQQILSNHPYHRE